jgi:hypothetical protein
MGIHSMAASSHPSHREHGTEREVTSRSRAGRSQCAGGCSSAMTVTIATQCQHSVETVRTPPPTVNVRATLAMARWLLNNPPLAHASPSAVEQWHHDVDQLIITTINTLYHEGGRHEPSTPHSCSPLATRAPPSACLPHQPRVPLSIAMTGLCDELIRHHTGEDSRIIIERHRERCHNIEGHNLEVDFESLTPA